MSIKILDRYVAKNVLSAIGLVTLMLAGLQIFILFVQQLGTLGRMDYGIKQAAVFVLMQMPFQVYMFFPVASLLGSLIGLAVLANHSELIVMRAAGMSIGQITGSVLKASLIVIVLATTLGETIIPELSHYANDYKSTAISGGQSIRTAQGVWLRFDNNFISINTILPDNVLQGVYEFQFDTSHNLKIARVIREVKFVDNAWIAYDINQTEFSSDHTTVKTFPQLPWDVTIKPKILKINSTDPDEMTLRELNRYIRDQKGIYQNIQSYRLSFLQRIIQPLTTMIMMVLAIPFIFGPLRSSSMGSKLLVGATVGFGFHIINRFFGPISAVYQWPIELAAFGPPIIFAVLGLYLMRRVR